MNTPSKELVPYTLRPLCEHTMRIIGADRDNSQGVLRDADWDIKDLDGSELSMRLIQLRGVGSRAIYLLRAGEKNSPQQSLYRLDAESNELTQRVVINREKTSPIWLNPASIGHLFHSDI